MKLAIKVSAIALTLLVTPWVLGGEINVKSGLSLQGVTQTINDKTENVDIDSNNIIVRPFLSVSYDARDLDILASVTHNHVRRALNDENVNNDYTDYNVSARYQIIPNLLDFRARGSQTFRSQAANSFLVDDFLLNAENLNKNTASSASLNLTLPTGRYFGINALVGVNSLSSEFAANQENNSANRGGLNNDGYNALIQIESGRDLRPFSYNISGNLRGVERQDQQNFESQLYNLRLGTDISSDFSLRVLGYYEDNNLSNNQAVAGNAEALRVFYSYGAGFAWQPAQNRFIELGYNRSITEGRLGEEDDEDDFISVDMQWNFSSRTSMSGNYSRRFFGDSGNFRFTHALRNWRTSLSYNETVTSNSQLFLNQEEGLLVCDNGSPDISDCRLSDDLDTNDLAANEILVPFVTDGFELIDRIVFRKAFSLQTAFDLRRTTLTATITDSSNEEVENARELDILTARISAAIKIGPRSDLTASVLHSEIQQNAAGEIEDSTVQQANLRFERKLSRRLIGSIAYEYLDRTGSTIGNAGGFQGINGPLTDNRISLEIRYEFDSNQ